MRIFKKKKLPGCSFLKQQLILLVIKKLFDVSSQNWMRKTDSLSHIATLTMDFLKEFFNTRIILKNLWPPHSPDLSPCDFFLWDYVKDKVFVHNPTSTEELKVKIMEVIPSTDVQKL